MRNIKYIAIHCTAGYGTIDSIKKYWKEMLKWAKVTNGINKIHIRNFDNYARYYAVRLCGGKNYNKTK